MSLIHLGFLHTTLWLSNPSRLRTCVLSLSQKLILPNRRGCHLQTMFGGAPRNITWRNKFDHATRECETSCARRGCAPAVSRCIRLCRHSMQAQRHSHCAHLWGYDFPFETAFGHLPSTSSSRASPAVSKRSLFEPATCNATNVKFISSFPAGISILSGVLIWNRNFRLLFGGACVI